MKKNIEIDKKEETVTVTINVDKRNYAREPIISFRTKDIALLLEKEGVDIESCMQSDTIYNDGRHPKITGEWVFKLKVENKPTPNKPSSAELLHKKSLTNDQKPVKIKSKTKTSKKRK